MKKFVTIYKNGIKINVDANVQKLKKCSIRYFWNANNCRCEMKKLATLSVAVEGCETSENIRSTENKTITLIKK